MLEEELRKKYQEYVEKCLQTMFEVDDEADTFIYDIKRIIKECRKIAKDKTLRTIEDRSDDIISKKESDGFTLYNIKDETGAPVLKDWYGSIEFLNKDSLAVGKTKRTLSGKHQIYFNYIDLNNSKDVFFKGYFMYKPNIFFKPIYSTNSDRKYAITYPIYYHSLGEFSIFSEEYNLLFEIVDINSETDEEILSRALKNIHEPNNVSSGVKNGVLGYKIGNARVKYKPVYKFKFHVLCEENSEENNEENTEYYLYSEKSGKYIKLGKKRDITFYNNMFINKVENTYQYLDSEGDKFIDISSIYSKLMCANGIKYNQMDVLSFEEFKKRMELEPGYIELLNKDIELAMNKRLEERKIEALKREKDKQNKVSEYLLQVREGLEKIEELSSNGEKIKRDRFPIGSIFYVNGDHREIKEEFLPALKYIDLCFEDFTNVKVSGVDLSDTNAIIDPQKVYNKDMSNGNFIGLIFGPLTNFNGVNITGAKFGKGILKESGIDFVNFSGAINDDKIK